MPEVNYLAIGVAAVVGFLVGGLWYSPLLFAKPWMRENGLTEERLKADFNPAKVYGRALVCGVIAAFGLAVFVLVPGWGPLSGAKRGAAAGFLLVGASLLMGYGFERRSTTLWAINTGYIVVQFAVMGAVIGAMSAH